MKRSTKSLRRYRDSQVKLIVARRRYKDALRRYRDAEEKEKVSKFQMLLEKASNKLEQFKSAHPKVSKLISILAKIRAVCLSINTVGFAAAGSAMLGKGIFSLIKEGKNATIETKQFIGVGLATLIISLLNAIEAYFTNKLSNKMNPDSQR